MTYRYNVTDSSGKTHKLVVGRQIYAREQGSWIRQGGWWLPYKIAMEFLDKHTSN